MPRSHRAASTRRTCHAFGRRGGPARGLRLFYPLVGTGVTAGLADILVLRSCPSSSVRSSFGSHVKTVWIRSHAVAASVWRGYPSATRATADIDLLFRRGDIERIDAVMASRLSDPKEADSE